MKKVRKEILSKKRRWKQSISMFLILCMMLTMLPISQMQIYADTASDMEVAEQEVLFDEKKDSGENATAGITEQVTITVHFRNTKKWSEVRAYFGEGNTDNWSAINGYDKYLSWPGVTIEEESGHPGFYSIQVVKGKDSRFCCIFNNGSSGEENQTGNLYIDSNQFTTDTCEFWADASSNISAKAPDDYTTPIVSPQVNGREVTFRYSGNVSSSVYLAGSMNGWSSSATPMTKDSSGIYSCTLTLAPGKYEYKFIVDAKIPWEKDPNNSLAENDNSLLIVPGLTDKEINVYRGEKTELPAKLTKYLPDGTTETVAVTYALKTEAGSDQVTLDTVNNTILVNDSYTEDTLLLTATAEGETATITLAISDGTGAIKSPQVNGREVTFRYQSETAGKVSLVGTMTDWGQNAKPMTKGADNVFSCTLTLAPGAYEYKFLVDNETWLADPKNPDIVGTDKNSALYVAGLEDVTLHMVKGKTLSLPAQLTYFSKYGEESAKDVTYTLKTSDDTTGIVLDDAKKTLTVSDTCNKTSIELIAAAGDTEATVTVGIREDSNKIIVKLHYIRSDADYDNWEAWVWSDTKGGEFYPFCEKDTDGNGVATIEVEEARFNQSISFVIREKDNWEVKDYGADRYIDVSDVLSGTVHYYIHAGEALGQRTLGEDALTGVKIKKAEYDRSANKITVTTAKKIQGTIADAFVLKKADGTEINITDITERKTNAGYQYVLTIDKDLSSMQEMLKTYLLTFDNYTYSVAMPNIYSSDEFESNYTYTGNDLGATWTEAQTTFKVWAPTADDVKVKLYTSGTEGTDDCINTISMVKGDKGVWSAVCTGDYQNKYYTYAVTVDGKTTEACDPYARTTGVNGKRAMILDLASTNPEGWENDTSPNVGMEYTDAIIYELHVRDLSSNAESGISEAHCGKFLGLTETGTKNSSGQSTGLDHIKDLGVTHIHLLPSYDYGSVDETKLDEAQYNWGYDPVNYNVPEGSYSTDPYHGEVRVREMKQMIQTLHENNINVIMDVVYNHVYDAESFCFNQLVPKYFSRTNEDGTYSNGSGCGNDTASERAMVKKYIVDSVNYWADEYHIDGFRFDLVGLLDTETINEVVNTVHKTHPDVVFYGEGWTMGTAVSKDGYTMATQTNSAATPEFAYFSDTIRDLLKGKNDETSLGYVSGLTGQEEAVANAFRAKTSWTSNPTQIVNYASCHDNYTLKDKINAARKDATEEDRIKMNNLAAAIYLTAEGIPLIHAGEEILRTKVDESGKIIHNSYNSSDYVNSLSWGNLAKTEYQQTRDYYKGLIEFRKNHAALRLTTAAEVSANVEYKWITNEVVLFDINGKSSVAEEVADGIVVIFNAANETKAINLYEHGVDEGDWKVCVNDEKAGIEVLSTVTDGNISVKPISAMVLVKGETEDKNSVYVKNIKDNTPNDSDTKVEAASVSLSETKVIIEKGKTKELTATVAPATATDKTVTWNSSNEKVATVDVNGKVKGIAGGTATITVTTVNGKKATCEVTVAEVTLNKSSLNVQKGKKSTALKIKTKSVSGDSVKSWSSSNTKVAAVSSKGKITAKKAGTATITVTMKSGATATCKVTVTNVILNAKSFSLQVGKSTTALKVISKYPKKDKVKSWKSSNTKVATVNSKGKITAKKVGKTTITVTMKSGATATCKVTVQKKKVTTSKLSLSATKLTILKGQKKKLTVTRNPISATEKITWESSDTKIASVDKNGKITAKKTGTVTITAKTSNGKKATCKVTVKNPSATK